jgi:hypothetical protein
VSNSNSTTPIETINENQHASGQNHVNGSPIRMVEIEETKKSNNHEKHKKRSNGNKTNKHKLIIDDEIDIHNVKRKTRADDGDPGPSNSNKKKGKAKETSVYDQITNPPPPPVMYYNRSAGPQIRNPPLMPVSVNYPKVGNSSGNSTVKKKVVRKKQALNKLEVSPPNVLQLLHSSSDNGVSLLQYLAKDRDAAKQLSQDLVALYRKKELNDGRRVIINALRNGDLLDEDAVSDTASDGSFEVVSEYSSDESSYYDDERDNDNDTVIDYPFDLNAMLRGKPVRALITINDTVVNATIDSGAGASVISPSLVNKLGLERTKVKRKYGLTGFNNATSESNQVVIDADVRIGGKLRREHFCIAENVKDRDLCLLGRTWLRKHKITVDSSSNSLVVPVGPNLNRFIEVKCVMDDNDEEYLSDEDGSYSTSMTPIYAVYLTRVDDENYGINNVEVNAVGNNKYMEGVNLDLYHEDVLSKTSSSSSGKNGKIIAKVEKVEVMPKEIQEVIDAHEMVFYEKAGLGRVKEVQHEIVTTTDQPINTRPYRLTRDEEECLEEELKTLLELGIIEPSNGRYTSPVFFVPKKDGKLRLVVNFQKLNDITVKDGYPLPHIDDILDSLGNSTCFTVLDAAFGFWQIPLHPNSVEKTGFCTKKGTYQFLTLPMGLSGSPSAYQRTMNNILKDYLGKFVYVFVDDYIVYSPDVKTHAEHLGLVFEACMKANLRLKKAKCQFCKEKVVYLGHEISRNGLRPNDGNIKKILQMREPKSSDECRSFLGTVGYYRRFIESFATKAAPITSMLKKNARFMWSAAQQDSFNYLQSTLISPPVLSYPIREFVKILTCDASTSGGLGCILSQSPSGDVEGEVVIAYGSKTLTGPEKNYTINHLEALAIIWAVNRYRHYLSSKEEFVIRTDHAALVYIFKNEKPSPKLQRWKACLMGYNYRIEYRPGKENPADSLSRLL